MADQGKSTLTIELDTSKAQVRAEKLAVSLGNVDWALGQINNKLNATKTWQLKIDMVMNPINVMDEFNKIHRVLNQSNQKIKLDAEFKTFAARNEIAKIQSTVNKTNQKIKLDVELRTTGVKNELGRVQQQVAAASGKIKIDVDTAQAKAGTVALTGEIKTQVAEISKMAQAVTATLNTQNEQRVQNARKAQDKLNAIAQESSKPYKNIGATMATAAVNTRPMEEAMRRRRELDEADLARKSRNEALLAQNELRASQNRVANYQREADSKRRMDETYNASKKSFIDRQIQTTSSTLKATPDVPLSNFKAKGPSAFADVAAIRAEAKSIEKAYGEMYAALQNKAREQKVAIAQMTTDMISEAQRQKNATVDAIKQEASLTISERKKAIAAVEDSYKQITASISSIGVASKQTWDTELSAAKQAMGQGKAAAKDHADYLIAEQKRIEAAKLASDRAIADAENKVYSHLELRLQSSKLLAKGMVDEFSRLNGLGNYEAVKNLETSLDKLKAGFANIKFGDNTAQLNGVQDKLTSAYQKAEAAAKAYSEGRNSDAIRLISQTKNEIATLEALKRQILSTGAAATTSLSGKSFMSESLKSASEQVQILASHLKELGNFTRFDSVSNLKSQVDSLKATITAIPNIGSKDLAKGLDLVATAYDAIGRAAIAASKNQGVAFSVAINESNRALQAVQKLEGELNRFSNAKIQTNQLSAAYAADAKSAIAAANEVKKIRLAAFDDEMNKARQSISSRRQADAEYMSAFESQVNKRRATFKAGVDAETRDYIAAIQARDAANQRSLNTINRMGEDRVGTREARNTVMANRLSTSPLTQMPGTQTAGIQQATQEAIRQQGMLQNIFAATGQAYARMQASNVSSTLMWIRNLYLVQKAFEMIGMAMSGLSSGFHTIKDTALTSQKMVTVMSVITGSMQSAREEVEWLRRESDKLGLNFEAAATPFAKFAAAAKGMFDPTTLHEMFTQLGKVSVAMHLDQVETKGVFLAIQQMASKGKVSLEELRLQFAERIPGAMTIAADSMDMTMTQFVKSVSNGEMMTQDFLPKFLANLEAAFGQAAEIASHSLTGSLARFENSTFKMWETIGKGGMAESIRKVADQVSKFIDNNTDHLLTIGAEIGRTFEGLVDNALSFLSDPSAQANIMSFINQMADGFLIVGNAVLGVAKTLNFFADIGSSIVQILKDLGMIAVAGYGSAIDLGTKAYQQINPTAEKPALTPRSSAAYAQTMTDKKSNDAILETKQNIDSLNRRFDAASSKVRKFANDYQAAIQDAKQAGEDALKPKFLSEHMEALDGYIKKMQEATKEAERLGEANTPKAPVDITSFRGVDTSFPTTALDSTPLGFKNGNYRDNAQASIDSLTAAKNDVMRQISALEITREAITKAGGDTSKITERINNLTALGNSFGQSVTTIKDNINKSKSDILEISTGMSKELKVVITDFEELTGKFAEFGNEIERFQGKKIDFSAMAPEQLTTSINDLSKATKDAESKVLPYLTQMDEIKKKQKETKDAMANDPGNASLAKSYEDQAVAADGLHKTMMPLFNDWKQQSGQLNEATKAMDAYTEQMYKAKTYMADMQRLQANKSQVDQMTKHGDISGLTAVMNQAGNQVGPLTEELMRVKQLEEQTKGNLTEHNTLIEKRLGIEADLQSAMSQHKDAADAILQLERKTSEAKQDQLRTELRIMALKEKFTKGSDFSTMTRSQLQNYQEEFSTTKTVINKVPVVLDTSAIETQVKALPPIPVRTGKLDVSGIIRDAAKAVGISEALVRAIAKAESNFNPNATGPQTRYGTAKGVMQLIDTTASQYGVRNSYDPQQNISGGAKYLKELLTKYKGDVALTAAAYNAGPGNVKKYGGIPPFKETQDYVKKVVAEYNRLQSAVQDPVKIDVNTAALTEAADDVAQLVSVIEGQTVKMSLFEQVVIETNQVKENLDRITKIQEDAKNRGYTKQESQERKALVTVLEEQSRILDKDLAKLNALNKAWDEQTRLIWERNNARRIAENNASDTRTIDNITRNRGVNAIPEINKIYDDNKSKLSELLDAKSQIDAKLSDTTSGGLQNGQELLTLEQRNGLVNKQAEIQAEINRLDAQNNTITQKSLALKDQELQLMDSQRDTLRDITLSNKYGSDGADRVKKQELLSPDAFKEWDSNRLKIQFENFKDAAGVSADGIRTSFTNAFQQILVDGASFTDTMMNMFKDMTNRIMNESINLIAKNLMSLGNGGSWGQIGLGVVGVGVGLLSQWANKQGTASPVSPATSTVNPNIIGSSQMYQADVTTRDIYVNSMIPTVQKWNEVVDLATTGLRSFSGSITEYGSKLLESIGVNFKGTAIASLIDSIKLPFETVYNYVSEFGNKLIAGGEELIKSGTSAILDSIGLGATALTSGYAIATNAPAQFGTLPVSLTANAGGAVTTASTSIGTKVGVNTISQFGSLPASATGSAATGGTAATNGLSALGGYATMFLSVVKFGYDLFKIIGNKTMTDMAKTSNALDAASTALLGIAAGLAATGVGIIGAVVALAIAGVLKVGSAATDSFEKGFSEKNISSLMGGIVGDIVYMIASNSPSATMLSFSGNRPDSGAIWDQNNQYFTSGQQKHDSFFAGTLWPGLGTQSASVGVKTDLGYVSLRLNDIDLKQSQIRDMALQTFIPTLDLIKKYNNQLGAAINSIDTSQGVSGATLTQFAKLQESRQWEKEQKLKSYDTGSMLGDLVKNYGDIFSDTSTLAGKTAGAWITAFSNAILDPKKNGAYNQIQALNVMDFVSKMMPDLVNLPLAVADLFAKNVKSISMGATQDEFIKQFTDFFTGWEIADKGLKSMGTDIRNTAIPEYLAGLVGLGFTVKDAAVQLVTYANALKEAGGYTNDTLNTIITDLLATAKEKKYSKDQVSGYVQSASLIGMTALDLGFKVSSTEIKDLASTLMDSASSATAAANAQIDKAITDNKLTKITREAAIQQLVLSGTLDSNTVRAADFNLALVDQTKKWTDAIGVFSYLTGITGNSLDTSNVAFKDFINNTLDFVDALGGADKAMQRLVPLIKDAMGETSFLAADAAMKRKNVQTNIYDKYGVNDSTVGAAFLSVLTDPKLSAAEREHIVVLGEQVLASKEASRALESNIASLREIAGIAFSPISAGLNTVDTSGQLFTDTMVSLAGTFGSAEAAANSFKQTMELVYNPSEMASKGVTYAQNSFDSMATQAGLQGLTVADAQQGLSYLTRNYREQGKGSELVTFNGKSATADVWIAGLTQGLYPLKQAQNALTQDTLSTASSVSNMGAGMSDFNDTVGTGSDKLATLAETVQFLTSTFDSLSTSTNKSGRDTWSATTQNQGIFEDAKMQPLWASLGVKTADEAQKLLYNQGSRTDYSQAVSDKNWLASKLDEKGMEVQKELFKTFANNTVTIFTPAIQSATDASSAYSQQIQDQAQKEKDLAAILKDVNDQIDSLKASDIGKIFIDINASIEALITSAAAASGTIPNTNELKNLKIQDAFKSFFTSFIDKWKTAGMSSTAKDIKALLDPYDQAFKDLQEFYVTANKSSPGTYSAQWLDEAKASLQTMEDLDVKEFVDDIIKSVSEEFNNIGKSDLKINLDGIITWMNEELQKAADLAAAGDSGAAGYKSNILNVAAARGRAATKDIMAEYLNIGATDYAKSLTEINTWLGETLQGVDLIAAAWNISTDAAKQGIKDIASARIKALDDERKKIIEDAQTDYNRTPSAMYAETTPIAADLEGQLWGIRDGFISTIASVIQKGGEYTDVLTLVNLAYASGTAAIEKARADVKAKFDSISRAIQDAFNSISVNMVRITEGDTAAQIQSEIFQRTKALDVLNNMQDHNYDDQMQAIDDLQSATMSRYDREKTAISELLDFVQELQDYTKSLLVNESLSPLSNTERLKEAGVQFQDTLAAATSPIESEARKKARGELTSTADTYLTEARKYYAGTPEYVKIFDGVMAQLKGITETGKSPQEQLVDLNRDMLLELEDASRYLQLIAWGQFGVDGAKNKELRKINDVIGKVANDFGVQVAALVKAAGLLTDVTADQVKIDAATIANDIQQLIADLSAAITNPALLDNIDAPIKAGLVTFARNLEAGLSLSDGFEVATQSVQRGINTLATNIQLGLSSLIWFEEPTKSVQAGINTFATNIQLGLSSLIWFEEPTKSVQAGINTLATNIQLGLSSLIWFEKPTKTVQAGINTFATNIQLGLSSLIWFEKPTKTVQAGINTFATNIQLGLGSLIWFEEPTKTVQAGINTFATNIQLGLSSLIWFEEPTKTVQAGINTFATNIQLGLSSLIWFEEPTKSVQAGINTLATNIQLGLGSLIWFEEPTKSVQAGINTLATNIQLGLGSLIWFEEPTKSVQAGINTFATNIQLGLSSLIWFEEPTKSVQAGINTFATNMQAGLGALLWLEDPTKSVQAGINTFATNIQLGLGSLIWFEEPIKSVQAGINTFATNIQLGLGSVPIDNSGIHSAINNLFGVISNSIENSINSATSTLAGINAAINAATIQDNSSGAGSSGTTADFNYSWLGYIMPIESGGDTEGSRPRKFASGGYYAGGIALVGERGPELINFESPGQIYNAAQTKSLLLSKESVPVDNSDVVNAIMLSARTNAKGQEELRKELTNAKEEIAMLNRKLAKLAADA